MSQILEKETIQCYKCEHSFTYPESDECLGCREEFCEECLIKHECRGIVDISKLED